MRVLLDTHAVLWFMAGDSRLPDRSRVLIADPDTVACVSVASLWEIAIKTSLGKLHLHEPFASMVTVRFESEAIDTWPIKTSHLSRLLDLPLHHRDPFDRLIVAQALVEEVPLVSRDGSLAQYGIEVIWT